MLDILGLTVERGSNRIIITLARRTVTVLTGLSRHAVREVVGAYRAELDEQRRLPAAPIPQTEWTDYQGWSATSIRRFLSAARNVSDGEW